MDLQICLSPCHRQHILGPGLPQRPRGFGIPVRGYDSHFLCCTSYVALLSIMRKDQRAPWLPTGVVVMSLTIDDGAVVTVRVGTYWIKSRDFVPIPNNAWEISTAVDQSDRALLNSLKPARSTSWSIYTEGKPSIRHQLSYIYSRKAKCSALGGQRAQTTKDEAGQRETELRVYLAWSHSMKAFWSKEIVEYSLLV